MIILKTKYQVSSIRKSCRVVAKVLSKISHEAKAGVTTRHLDKLAEDLCYSLGAVPGFKGYKGFPYTICASKNSTVVHGFPDDEPLKEGDLLSVDFGAVINGWYGDAAITLGIGVQPYINEKLLGVGAECLLMGIAKIVPHGRLGDVSHAIQHHTESNGFNVVKNFVGHGVGRDLHELPQIPNFGKPRTGLILKPGMVLAIEPMITEGSSDTETLSDGWTTVTKDKKMAVHFEHTVVVTKEGVEVLTGM